MDVSVIICTRNRASDLKETLRSLAQVTIPPAVSAELVIVDNGSTDNTREVIEQFSRPGVATRYVFETKPGLSNARNAGIAQSSGRAILFTDDDLRFPDNWFTAMTEPLLSGKSAAIAGGIVLASHLRRDWQTRPALSFAATGHLDKGNPGTMLGANMAFARTVLEKVPRFDPELGAGALGFNEESLFSAQLREAGYAIASALDVCVEHHPSPDRFTRNSLLDAAVKLGRSHAYVRYHWEHKSKTNSLVRAYRQQALLMLWRALNRAECQRHEGISEQEFYRLVYISENKQFHLEQKRPRNYRPKGLVKGAV